MDGEEERKRKMSGRVSDEGGDEGGPRSCSPLGGHFVFGLFRVSSDRLAAECPAKEFRWEGLFLKLCSQMGNQAIERVERSSF